MNRLHRQWAALIFVAVVFLSRAPSAVAADEPTLNREQIKQFLLTAKIIGGKQSSKGTTGTSRVTLSDGTVTHDASFQAIDVHKATAQLGIATEMNFVDSYKYNI